MKRRSTAFLQIAIVVIGICAAAFLVGEPHDEGRNANATLFEVYFYDPFLAYVYVASIPFFVGLYQVFKLCSEVTVKALRTLKFCALAVICFVAGTVFMVSGDPDAGPVGIIMRILVTVPSVLVAITAAKFERKARASGLV